MGHTLTDNRHGLVVNAVLTQADGFAEREAAKDHDLGRPSSSRECRYRAHARCRQGLRRGWAKFVAPIRQVMGRGIKKVDQLFVLTMAASNLVRMWTLAEVRPLAAKRPVRASNAP